MQTKNVYLTFVSNTFINLGFLQLGAVIELNFSNDLIFTMEGKQGMI